MGRIGCELQKSYTAESIKPFQDFFFFFWFGLGLDPLHKFSRSICCCSIDNLNLVQSLWTTRVTETLTLALITLIDYVCDYASAHTYRLPSKKQSARTETLRNYSITIQYICYLHLSCFASLIIS